MKTLTRIMNKIWPRLLHLTQKGSGVIRWIIKWFDVSTDGVDMLTIFRQIFVSLAVNILTDFCNGARQMPQSDGQDSNLASCVTAKKMNKVERLKASLCRQIIGKKLLKFRSET